VIRLVQELAADGFPVAVTCRVLEVPTSTYYEAIKREPSAREVEDRHLTGLIVEVHEDSRGTYGAPRVHAELRMGLGLRVGRKRVARLMRCAGIHGVSHRRKKRHRPDTATHDDLVQRRFSAEGPDRVWFTDSVASLLPSPASRGGRLGLLLRGHRRVQSQGRGLVDR
jgi:hypothetical protein